MSTFDLSFDRTFRELLTDSTTPTQSGCRKEGIYLTWLTLQGGWMYWLFEGNWIKSQSPSARGVVNQGGLINATQKETAQSLLISTINLTEAEAELVGTIRESNSVYWLKHNADDTVQPIRVTVPTDSGELWNARNYVNSFSTVIVLPSRRSQLY